jgi:phage gpG-like protein
MSDLFNVQVKGLEQLDRVEEALNKGLNIDKILDEGSAIIFNRLRTRFLEAMDPSGDPWVVSKAAEKRAESGRGGLTGFDSGNLFHSLQLFRDADWERSIGTDVDYGPYFQWGPPVRLFLGFAPDDEMMMERLVEQRISEVLNG